MKCSNCSRKIPPGRPHYCLQADLRVCSECVFHAPIDVHALAAPTCDRNHGVWEHPRALELRRGFR